LFSHKKIAFLGSRGIPRCYSGFETFVEEVSTRLAARGHNVTVYNRTPFNKYLEDEFKGVHIVRLPTIPAKGTDTLFHSAICTLHAIFQKYDIVYYCGVGSAIFSLPAKLGGTKTLVNVDGADWERAKWGTMGKTWLRLSEALAARLADSVIADHPVIRDRYRRQFGIECALISYGAEVVTHDPGHTVLQELQLKPQDYFLYVSRLTPENGADLVMEAHLASDSRVPLIVVGDAPYVSGYLEKLRELESRSQGRIRMVGYRFGDAYRQLSFHARGFIFPTTIEATRPVLLEQMGMGSCVIARDTPSNRHILGEAAFWFSQDDPVTDLARVFRQISSQSSEIDQKKSLARERIRSNYNWDVITSQYENLFQDLKKES
jgi:glycosyltransferase involved in cell wall biosynthesis